jgi:hypothetical protein
MCVIDWNRTCGSPSERRASSLNFSSLYDISSS